MSNHPRAPGAARAVLRALSYLVPPEQRERWLREWDAEFVHRWHSGRPLPPIRTLTRLVSALRDTLHIRRLTLHPETRSGSSSGRRFGSLFEDRYMMREIVQDVRFGLRTLRKSPLFTLVSIATLGLGIGVSLAVFGIVNAAVIRPLPFPEPHRLVMGRATFDGNLNPWAAGADYYDYRDQAGVFESLAALLPFETAYTITGAAEPERVYGTTASENLFSTLRAQPQLGRVFTKEEGLAGAPNVVVISHEFWQRRFGGAESAVGQPVTVNGNPFTVVGVMPAGFHFMTEADIWFPMRPDRDSASERRFHNWLLVGRLAGGATMEGAQSQVDVISAQLQESYPETNAQKALLLEDLQDVLLEDYRLRLFVLTGAVGLVLLIACGNVTGMLLARAPTRRHELSVRAALGAGRSRVARQLLSESMVLASAGGIMGVGLAFWFQQVILDFLQIERLGIREAGVSTPMLLSALVISLGTGLLAGLYPALRGACGNLARDLKEGARNSGGGGTGFRSSLVVAQVALSIVLLVGAGLLIRSLALMRAEDPGFDARSMLTLELELPVSRYPDAATRSGFYSELLAEAQAIPGVRSVAITSHIPIRRSGNTYRARVPGQEGEGERVFLRSALPGYFATMGIPLLMGRGVQTDGEAPPVVVISETMVRASFPNESPLGKQLELDWFGTPRIFEVVGVVGDVRLTALELDPENALYLPYSQFASRRMGVVIRTDVPPTSLAGEVRNAVRRLDRNIPVVGLSTIERDIADSVADRRLIALALALYALLPLLLAGVGLYAVVAYYVAQRVHEIGVRMALGADSLRVGTLILRRGATLVSIGIVTGLGGAFGLTRLIRGLLFGVEPTDPGTFLAVAAFVFLVAVVACAVPTWRAVRSDPKVALQAT